MLAKEGWRVCVLERNDWLGGAIKTVDGLTAPGFTHEVFSSWHPLWVGSPAYAELKPDLDALGLEYLNTDLPTAAAFPDGSSAFLSTDGAANVAELGDAWQRQFDEFMAGAEIAFGVLGTELWSGAGLSLGRKAYSHYGRRGLVEFAGHTLLSARDWLTDTFEDERTRGLLAPWVLHTGLGPDQAVSGFMTQVIACALQLGGMPVPKGGGIKLVEGLATIIRDAGGELRTETPTSSGSSSPRAVRPRSGWRTASRFPPRAPCSPASRRRSCTGGCSARATRRRTCATPRSASVTAAARCRSTSR